jgi:hypothetical protein
MATILQMRQLLQWVNSRGINPDLYIDPEYIGFQQEDMKKYGYFLLFVFNLSLYASDIWNPKTADYCCVMFQKERNRIIAEEEEKAENESSDTESDNTPTYFEVKETKNKKAKSESYVSRKERDYITDMLQFKYVPRVYFKTEI